jgi:hypothetical protein
VLPTRHFQTDKEVLYAYALAEEVLDDEALSRLGETCAADRSEANG